MIYNKYLESGTFDKVSAVFEYLKKGINVKNIIFLILSFLLASVQFMREVEPFSMVLFGVASVFNVPLLVVLIPSVISMLITSVTISGIIKMVAFFLLFSLITAFINIEGVSKKYAVYIKLMISYLIVEIVSLVISGVFLTSLLTLLTEILVITILYFIFVPGMAVMINLKKSYVYSKEESVAMITVLAIALSVLKDISVFSFSIYNILVMVLILIYGWKNGAIMGTTSGLLIGLLLTGITDANMSLVVSLAISGGIAGILSRFGKIPVIIGFVLGNIYVAYSSSGFSYLTLRMSEMLIASTCLLFMPRVLELKLDKLFNKNNTIEGINNNILSGPDEAKEKIGAVSEVFESLANITIENTEEDLKETREVIKKYIVDYIENNCIDCKDKRNCLNEDSLNLTVDYIASKLEHNEKINSSMLGFKCYVSDDMVEDIEEIYNSMKLTRILKKKEEENSKKLSSQYKEVSKILATVAQNIKENMVPKDKLQIKLRDELKFYGYIVYEDGFVKNPDGLEYTFVTDILTNIDNQKKEIIDIVTNILEQPMTIKLILNSSKKEKSRIKLVSKTEYDIKTSIVSEIKSGEEVSGDSYLSMELEDLKHLSVISDGAGSGTSASKSSIAVINMLEKLLASGFSEDKAIEIINSVIKLKADDTSFSTLDAFIFDLKTSNAEIIKLGAAPTYIIEDGKIITINTSSMPVGIIKESDYVPIVKKLKKGSIVIQISDGVVKDGMDVNDNYFKNYLANIDTKKTPKAISDELRKFVLRENKGLLDDDVTIIVNKVLDN